MFVLKKTYINISNPSDHLLNYVHLFNMVATWEIDVN